MCEEQRPPLPPLVVGLGNPGDRYRRHRHNLGFLVVEALARDRGTAFPPSASRYQWVVLEEPACVLLKPLTYMNLSGEAVTAWLADQGPAPAADLDPARLLVVCDDLALPLGALRLRGKGSSGGQNGLASIIAELGSDQFARLRLGIDGTGGELDPAEWADYVLADFLPDERPLVDLVVEQAVWAVRAWLEDGPEKAASRFNGLVALPRED